MAGILSGLASFFESDAGVALGLAVLGTVSVVNNERNASANIDAARIAAEGRLAEARAIEEGNRLVQGRFDAIQEQAAPAQSYLRGVVVADPTQLTPFQKQQLDESRREITNTLATSGLRGAGRSQVAAFRAIEGDARNRLIDANRDRRDKAASTLSGQYVDAASSGAKLQADTGKAIGTALRNIGDVNADVTTTNVANRGQVMGDLTSLITSEFKERGRESRYRDRVASRTKDEGEDGYYVNAKF